MVEKSHLGDAAYEFATAFGSMIYVCDAFEDFRDDVRSGAFNPLAVLHGPTMSNDVRADALALVHGHFERIRALSEQFSREAGTRHITQRIALNIDRVFQAQSAQADWPLTRNLLADRYRAFTSQTRLQFALISDQNLTPVRQTLRKMSAILPTLFSTFILGCYTSPVPLANRVPIDPALLGVWKRCDAQAKNAGDNTTFQRLNANEYLLFATNSDDAGKVTKTTSVAYPSRIGNKLFLSIPQNKDGKVLYMFLEVQIKERTLETRFMDAALFKVVDKSDPMVFDSSEELTKFVDNMIADEKLLMKERGRLCR